MNAHLLSRARRDRVSALRTLATLEPSLCTLASRGMPLHECSSRAQEDLSVVAVAVSNYAATISAELDLAPRRYERGRTMALQARVSLRALAERGLAYSSQRLCAA